MKAPSMNNRGKLLFFWISIVGIMLYGCARTELLMNREEAKYVPVLEYYVWSKGLSETEVKSELAGLERQKQVNAVVHPVQTAILLAAVDPGHTEKALVLIEQAINQSVKGSSGVEEEYYHFAYLWQDMMQQRNYLEQSIREFKNRSKEYLEKARKIEKENKHLREQIDALKSIEKKISDKLTGSDVGEQ